VRDDDLAQALRQGRIDEREGLLTGEMAGREHEPVGGDAREDRACRRQRPALAVHHRDRLDLNAASCWSRAQTGGVTPGSSTAPASLTASTVGNQTTRAPSRAAISTASAFSPPTARFSAIAPSTVTSGQTAETTEARSAVEV
jgi:hypothetical protein